MVRKTDKNWTTRDEDGDSEAIPILCDGETFEADEDEDFSSTIKKLAREAGWGRFRVFVDGKELEKTSEAPETFEGLDEVKISKYDEAGC